jgi:hypothetical protein
VSVDYFTPQQWALENNVSWSVFGYSSPSPWPVFDSDAALVAAFVAANPDANVCGTTPYLYQDFTYHWTLDDSYGDFDFISDMKYTDPIVPAIASSPDVPFGRTLEEG